MGFLPFILRASSIVFGLLWASIQDYPLIHWLPLPLLSTVHVYCTITHFTTKFLFVCSCCIPLPYYLALWHASDGPNHLLLLLGKIPSQQDIFPKRSYGRKPNIDPLFPPLPNHALWIPLTVGPPPLYWPVTGWWCPGPSVFALLSSVFVCHAVPAVVD